MERITKEFTRTIQNVDYTFSIEFGYYPGKYAIDPTDSESAQMDHWDFYGPIHAWDNVTDIGYEVDPDQFMDLNDIYSLFEEAIS